MKKTTLPCVDLLDIAYKGRNFYGVSQEFYPRYIQRLSGCGPTTASNQLAYLATVKPHLRRLFPYDDINYSTMISFMNTLWEYIKPGYKGVNTVEKLARGVEEYGRAIRIPIKASVFSVEPKSSRPDLTESYIWLEGELRKGNPIAFLSLDPGQVFNLERWHWVLLVGVSLDGGSLMATVYDEGRKKVVDLGLWLDSTSLNGGFVSFS